MAHLQQALAAVRELAVYWASERGPDEWFVDFEAKQIEALRQVGRASTEVPLEMVEAKHRQEHPDRFEVGETAYRLTLPEPRSLRGRSRRIVRGCRRGVDPCNGTFTGGKSSDSDRDSTCSKAGWITRPLFISAHLSEFPSARGSH